MGLGLVQQIVRNPSLITSCLAGRGSPALHHTGPGLKDRQSQAGPGGFPPGSRTRPQSLSLLWVCLASGSADSFIFNVGQRTEHKQARSLPKAPRHGDQTDPPRATGFAARPVSKSGRLGFLCPRPHMEEQSASLRLRSSLKCFVGSSYRWPDTVCLL